VLIGTEASKKKYVLYEIKQSYIKEKGLLGVYVHNLKDKDERTDSKGSNPFDCWSIKQDDRKILFSELYPTYDWVTDKGYENFANWVEKAAKDANR
jgi:hypothetical protein